MSANLKGDVYSDFSKDFSNSWNKYSVNMSTFCLIIFVGMSDSCIAFELSRRRISFLISDLDIVWKVNVLFKFFSFMAFILGWYLYFSLALRTGSSNWSGFTDGSSYGGMFKFDTTFEKKSFRVDQIFSSSFSSNSFSISVILEKDEFLSENEGFTVLQKDLLPVTFLWSRLL